MMRLLTATAVAMGVCQWNEWPLTSGFVCVLLVALATVLPPRVRWALLTVVVCAYGPYAWLLDDYPWQDYRWGWIGMWPILPGMLPGAYFFHSKYEFLELPVMGVSTLVFLMTATFIGAQRKRLLLFTALIILALSILNSVFLYGAFRA